MKIKAIKRGQGLTELKRDFKAGILLGITLGAFFILGLVDAPLIGWALYAAWVAFILYANRPIKKRRRKFQHFEIERDEEVAA